MISANRRVGDVSKRPGIGYDSLEFRSLGNADFPNPDKEGKRIRCRMKESASSYCCRIKENPKTQSWEGFVKLHSIGISRGFRRNPLKKLKFSQACMAEPSQGRLHWSAQAKAFTHIAIT